MVGAQIGELKIKPAKLRGVESNGMLCSAKELGLDNDASGLLELPDDAPVGQALSSGRLDAGIMSMSTANQFLVAFGNLRVLDGVMVREPLAFAVGPNAFRLK
ncbi:hypothetical protein G6F22_016912 [Rhizopus arrhizus]|nr:hypothetical protein G6F22_016912 [Rhizopus arrhizus]